MFQSYALFPHLTVDGQRRLRPQAGRPAAGRDRGARRRDAGAGASSKASAPASRTSFPAASASAWRSRARWSSGRACCCSTSRWRRSTSKLREETQFELMDLQEQARPDLRHRHPRPGGGDDGRRPHRRDGRAAGWCRSRTPSEIYEQPNSRWVADFIGDVNLIEGRVVVGGRGRFQRSKARAWADCAPRRRRCASRATRSGSRCGRRRCGSRDAPPANADENCVAGRVCGHRLSRRRLDLQGAARQRPR